jgi:uncharacterized protein YuzE
MIVTISVIAYTNMMEIRFSRHAKNKLILYKLSQAEIEEAINSSERLNQGEKTESRRGKLRIIWLRVGSHALVITVIRTTERWMMVGKTRIPEIPKRALKIEYEPEVDVLTIYLQEPETPLDHSAEAEPGLILNYSGDGSLSSIEILDASKRYPTGQLAAHSVDEFIDLRTASELSTIAPVTLRTQAEKGKLWAIRLGGQWVTTRDRLQQYIDSRARKAKTSN